MFHHPKPRYSIKDLLELTHRGRAKIYEDNALGRLKTYKVGKRRFASPTALDEYIELEEREGAQ
jgi:hypothetical protein